MKGLKIFAFLFHITIVKPYITYELFHLLVLFSVLKLQFFLMFLIQYCAIYTDVGGGGGGGIVF
jgi:hypothetical protein